MTMAEIDGLSADVLKIRGLTKSFGRSVVLEDVDIDLRPGEVHALCGANGSGKSTLVKVLAGFHEADAGTVQHNGEHLIGTREGLERLRFIHQDLGLVPTMNAAENISLGEASRGWAWRRVHSKNDETEAARLLHALGADIDVRAHISDLKPVERSMVAIARATQHWDAQGFLVLDEPTATMPKAEVERLFSVVKRLTAAGAGVLYVTHRLEEIFEIADVVTVLRDGKKVLHKPVADLSQRELSEAIVGREIAHVSRAADAGGGEPRLEARNLFTDELEDFSVTVRSGEIVGVTGLIGSGMEQLADVLSGYIRLDSGTVQVQGARLDLRSPRHAIAAGIATVPADRHGKGCILLDGVRDNISLAAYHGSRGSSYVRQSVEKLEAARWAAHVELQRGSIDRPMATLSGGNQQKVVFAKALRTGPSVLVMDEPTQGVDVGAKAAIYQLVANAADDGMAVLAISTDVEELAQLCDRVLVVVDGRVDVEVPRAELTSPLLTELLLGQRQPV